MSRLPWPLTFMVVLLLVVLAVACLHLLLRSVSADAPTGQSWSQIGRGYWRVADHDFGVVCYTVPFPDTAIACVWMK